LKVSVHPFILIDGNLYTCYSKRIYYEGAVVATENAINTLCADVLSNELSALGLLLDQLDSSVLPTPAAERAETYKAVATRARKLITSGVDVPSIRKGCLKSPSLMAILEAVLFDRAATRGSLALSIDWSGYGR
jgi:hypothetical protein